MASAAHTTPLGVLATGLPPGNSHALLAELIRREQLRNRIEAAVARLIDALDAIDGDADLEPSLGAPEVNATCTEICRAPDGRWFSARTDQEDWANGAGDDREDGDDGREPADCPMWGGQGA